jgi:hypothetical protein
MFTDVSGMLNASITKATLKHRQTEKNSMVQHQTGQFSF